MNLDLPSIPPPIRNFAITVGATGTASFLWLSDYAAGYPLAVRLVWVLVVTVVVTFFRAEAVKYIRLWRVKHGVRRQTAAQGGHRAGAIAGAVGSAYSGKTTGNRATAGDGADTSVSTQSEPAIGYRVFHVLDTQHGWRLSPCIPAYREEWPREGLDARHNGQLVGDPGWHRPPHPGCTCGIYALHEVSARSGGLLSTWLRVMIGEAGGRSRSVIGSVVVPHGEVEVWTEGIRASFAKVTCLLRPTPNDTTNFDVDALAAHYGVPVVATVEALRMVATEHGQPLEIT